MKYAYDNKKYNGGLFDAVAREEFGIDSLVINGDTSDIETIHKEDLGRAFVRIYEAGKRAGVN